MSQYKRVLVFGQTGQVGGYLTHLISESDKYKTSDLSHYMEDGRFDLSHTDRIASLIYAEKPDWIVNAAAYTAVDQAEDDGAQCHKINVDAPEQMAVAAKSVGAGFIHYSTDYVFDGQSKVPYSEVDATNPPSVYGRSKLEGERAVLDVLPEAIVLRTAWVYAKVGKNFVNTMLRLAEKNSSLSVVDDQVGCPTFARDLAQATLDIIRAIEDGEVLHQGGIYHATGQGQASWYQFCRRIMHESKLTHIEVRPISSKDFPTRAPRPKYSVLDNSKLRSVYGIALPDWQSALGRMLTDRESN